MDASIAAAAKNLLMGIDDRSPFTSVPTPALRMILQAVVEAGYPRGEAQGIYEREVFDRVAKFSSGGG